MLFSRLFAFTAVLALVAKTDAAPAIGVDVRLNKLSPKLDEVAKNDTKHEVAADNIWYTNLTLNVRPPLNNENMWRVYELNSIGTYDCEHSGCGCTPVCDPAHDYSGCTDPGYSTTNGMKLQFYSQAAPGPYGVHAGCSFYVGHTNNVCSIMVKIPWSGHNTMTCSCTDPSTKIYNADLSSNYCDGHFPIAGHQFSKSLTLHAPECSICWRTNNGDQCLNKKDDGDWWCSGPLNDGPKGQYECEMAGSHDGLEHTWCPFLHMG